MGIIQREHETGGKNPELNVYDETEPLQTLMVWGEPSCEAILAQMLPPEISLFFRDYDVLKARHEYEGMLEIIRNRGVTLVRAKDAFAQLLDGEHLLVPGLPKDIHSLSQQIIARGLMYHEQYGNGNLNSLDLVLPILEQDAENYGEEAAIKLNWILSLAHNLPLGNIYFGRDQSNVLGKHIVMSNMRWPIRQPEVAIYRRVLEHLGYENSIVDIHTGTIEGGDSFMFNNRLLIGVGIRTSIEAVLEIYQKIGNSLSENGIKIAAVVDPNLIHAKPQNAGEEMQAMHLDTFSAPIRTDLAIICPEIAEARQVFELENKGAGLQWINKGNYAKYLSGLGVELIPVSRAEQLAYATNLLNLQNGNVLVPLSQNGAAIAALQAAGIFVTSAEIYELIGGYGAVHCMTASLVRGSNAN